MSRANPTPSNSRWSLIRNVANQPQFQSNFFSSAAASLVSHGLQLGVGGFIYFYNIWRNYNPHDLALTVEHYERGIRLQNAHKYAEALKDLTHARIHFERTLHTFSQHNTRLHQLYCNISYSQALAYVYCGQLDDAKTVIQETEQRMLIWKTSYKDADLFNLKGVVFLKEKNYAEAKIQFGQSLHLNPSQKEIVYLYTYTQIRDEKSENPDKKEQLDYLKDRELFNPATFHPIAFEINMAFISSLLDGEKPTSEQLHACLKNLFALEEVYKEVDLAYKDVDRIYEMMLAALNKQKEKISAPPGSHQADQKAQPLPTLKLAEIEELIKLYQVKKNVKNKVNKRVVDEKQASAAKENSDVKLDTSTTNQYARLFKTASEIAALVVMAKGLMSVYKELRR